MADKLKDQAKNVAEKIKNEALQIAKGVDAQMKVAENDINLQTQTMQKSACKLASRITDEFKAVSANVFKETPPTVSNIIKDGGAVISSASKSIIALREKKTDSDDHINDQKNH